MKKEEIRELLKQLGKYLGFDAIRESFLLPIVGFEIEEKTYVRKMIRGDIDSLNSLAPQVGCIILSRRIATVTRYNEEHRNRDEKEAMEIAKKRWDTDLEIEIIAPGHGPAYDKPDFILNAYRDWASDEVKNEVVIPYISMHGGTKKMVDYFAEALIERGITVKLAMALVDVATVVIGSPTVLLGPHPKVVYAACLANTLRPKLKFVSIIGSYGGGSRMVEILDPVVIKEAPKEADFIALDGLADEIVNKHKEHGIT